MMIRRIGFLVAILLFSLSFGQKSKEALQKQNAEIKKKIAAINADLAKTKKEAQLSLAYLNNINTKLNLREKVYNNTQKEKRFIEDDIYLRQLQINKFNRELSVLRKEYARILVNAYKNKGVQNRVTFILSSGNLGQALRRVQYLKQYSDYQNRKAEEISEKARQIKYNISLKQKSVNEKQRLLARQKQDLSVIEAERKQKQLLLEEFKKNESRLAAELKVQQGESKKLEGAIRNIINEEIRIAKAKEEARKKEEAEKIRLAKIAADREKARIDAENKAKLAALEEAKRKAEAEERKTAELAKKRADEEQKAIDANKAEERRFALEKQKIEAEARAKAAAEKATQARAAQAALTKKTEEQKVAVEKKAMTSFGVGSVVSSNFAENRGRLAFPVDRGQVTHRFGRQPHPVFKNIVEENNGIRIAVPAGSKAKAVYPGVVSRIIVSGGAKTVLVKHGNYFTIYGNLSNVYVGAGQNIPLGTAIGEITTDFDGAYSLDFQVWNGSTPVDPLSWVSY